MWFLFCILFSSVMVFLFSLLCCLLFSTLFHTICESSSQLITPCLALPSDSSTLSLALQFNLTNLDWNQLSKKECVKYGGSLVGPSCKYVPDLALMSFILFFGTYSMTVSLKKFKFSRYFPTKVRRQEILNTYFCSMQ